MSNQNSEIGIPLTFLFTDLEGSTLLWQRQPEAMMAALARHDDLLRAAVEAARGRVVKNTGDGIHAVFDSVQDALSACIQAQCSLQAEHWGETGPLKVRMGLHCGEAHVRAGDYFGAAVNHAARLMDAAHGGQVLLSGVAAGLAVESLPDGVAMRDLGAHRLKDLLQPVRVYQLLHPALPADFPAIASLDRLPDDADEVGDKPVTAQAARLGLTFFGAFQATLDGRPLTHFRSANNQGLLVYLALQCERPFPRETLATLFWPDESDQNARNNLRQSLYQLRKLLGDLEEERAGPPFLLAERLTAQFNPDSDYSLDVRRFLLAVERRDLQAAAGYYQGELLPGFTCDSAEFEDWLRQQREYLHRLALETLTLLTQEHIQHGRLDHAQAAARRQLSLEPWREIAHRQLMQAYALAGDRANALAQFETAREILWDELGLEPAAETAALLEEIRAGRYAPAVSDAYLRPPARIRHNLPADATPFIGRELELAQIGRLLAEEGQRLVSIVAPGGMGKTRLALAAGRALLERFPDGVCFVNLAPLADPREIGPTMAVALDYRPPDKERDVLPQLLESLANRRLLLILDNFEHLLAGATLVNDILQSCPTGAVLATSRQRLNLASEVRYELGGLDYPQDVSPVEARRHTALMLFEDSGRRVLPGFALNEDNTPAVIRICRLAQGMPLALLLAAAWLDVLSPAEIAAEIEQSLDFLSADLADLPPRQRSMQAVFECTWGMMSPAEQSALASLSVFRGSFSREAAQQVAGASLRVMQALVGKSLLHRHAENDGSAAGGRFSMHELLRQYAAEQRRRADPDDAVALAHCRYYAGRMGDEVRLGIGFSPMHIPGRMSPDRDNLRRAWTYAVEHGLGPELQEMVRGIAALSFGQGQKPHGLIEPAIRALEQRGRPQDSRTLLFLRLFHLGFRIDLEDLSALEGEFPLWEPLVEAQADPELSYWYFVLRGYLAMSGIRTNHEALVWWERGREAAVEMGDAGLADSAETLIIWYEVENDLQEPDALQRLHELLARLEPDYPDSLSVEGLLIALGIQYAREERHADAIHYAARSLEVAKRWRDLKWIGETSYHFANTYLQMGRLDKAAERILDLLEWHLAIGQTWQTLGCMWAQAVGQPQLLGGEATAVRIMSMVFHHPETLSHYQYQIESARSLYVEELGEEAYWAEWEAGKKLSFDDAAGLMRAGLIAAGALQ